MEYVNRNINNNEMMKKILFLSFALTATLPVMANLNGEGYYRVQNFTTERYASVVDNRGSIDLVGTNADLNAINLNRDFDNVCCDPASVLFLKPVGGEFNIMAQGTSVYEIIEHYVSIMENGEANGHKLYMCYGTMKGFTKYLGDKINNADRDDGKMSINCTGDNRKWYIHPIKADGDNFFGARPSAEVTEGEYQGFYATLYTSFPMSVYSDGVEFYTVSKVGDWGQFTIEKTSGVIPASTPIIVKCKGATPSENRINIGGEGTPVNGIDDFKGYYFNCGKGGHINRIEYDRETMRVLGTCEDGSLGFVQADIDYIPANSAYLTVPAGSPAEYKCVSEEEYTNGVESIIGDTNHKHAAYTMTGIKISDNINAEEMNNLPSGMYVIGGKKVVIK